MDSGKEGCHSMQGALGWQVAQKGLADAIRGFIHKEVGV